MEIQQPKTKSDFEKYFEFRWRMLRNPWEQPPGSEQDELEHESFHTMVVDDTESVIAVGRVHFLSDSVAQIRYMAVAEHRQHQGLGRLVVDTLEQYVRSHGRHTVMLHARENALGFYQRQGYQTIRKSHVLYKSIQHYEMRKTFTL